MGFRFNGSQVYATRLVLTVLVSLGASFGACLPFSTALAARSAAPAIVDNSGFEYKDGRFSTLTARLLRPRQSQPLPIPIPSLPGRQAVPIFQGRNQPVASALIQPGPAPVLFLIPGLGGTAFDGAALYLGELAFLNGYSVISVDSPFSWQFVLSRSNSAIPGYLPADAADLTAAFRDALSIAEKSYGLKATSYSVAGYSMGALDALWVKWINDGSSGLNFKRAILINPPIDMAKTLSGLEIVYREWKSLNKSDRDRVKGDLMSIIPALLQRDIHSPSYFQNLDQQLKLPGRVAWGLVSESMKQTQNEAIFVGQLIHDLGVLQSPVNEMDRAARNAEIETVSFEQYLSRFVVPGHSAETGLTDVRQMLNAVGLLTNAKRIASDSGIFLLHAADDPLNDAADLPALQRAFGASRSVVFKYGGHVGNLWDAGFQSAFTQFLTH